MDREESMVMTISTTDAVLIGASSLTDMSAKGRSINALRKSDDDVITVAQQSQSLTFLTFVLLFAVSIAAFLTGHDILVYLFGGITIVLWTGLSIFDRDRAGSVDIKEN